MKNIIKFLIILIPWYLSSLIPIDKAYYNSLTLPFFTPPPIFYGIAWTITYIGIAISIYQILTTYKLKEIPKSYKYTLLINYLCNQSFQLVFFLLKNRFLGFVSCIATFITALFLYKESNELKEKSTKYLNPYVLLSLFASFLSLIIYLLNVV